MGRYETRLARLEAFAKGRGPCSGCGLSPRGPGRIVLVDDGIPEEGFPADPNERCDRCGRRMWCVIEVVYDSSAVTEGRGVGS